MKIKNFAKVGFEAIGAIGAIMFGQKAIDKHVEKQIGDQTRENARLKARADFYKRLYEAKCSGNEVFGVLFGNSNPAYRNKRIVIEAEEIVEEFFKKEYL